MEEYLYALSQWKLSVDQWYADQVAVATGYLPSTPTELYSGNNGPPPPPPGPE
jgi:hypothetical protein